METQFVIPLFEIYGIKIRKITRIVFVVQKCVKFICMKTFDFIQKIFL